MFLELVVAGLIKTQTLIMEGEGVAVRLLNAQCPISAVEGILMAEKRRTDPRLALIRINGKEIRGCWVLGEEDKIIILDEDGDGGFIPANAFRPVPVI